MFSKEHFATSVRATPPTKKKTKTNAKAKTKLMRIAACVSLLHLPPKKLAEFLSN